MAPCWSTPSSVQARTVSRRGFTPTARGAPGSSPTPSTCADATRRDPQAARRARGGDRPPAGRRGGAARAGGGPLARSRAGTPAGVVGPAPREAAPARARAAARPDVLPAHGPAVPGAADLDRDPVVTAGPVHRAHDLQRAVPGLSGSGVRGAGRRLGRRDGRRPASLRGRARRLGLRARRRA